MRFEYYESIDSTNDELKRRISGEDGKAIDSGLVISAATQTAGRGRSGHIWSSPAGSSIATSMLIWPEGLPESAVPQLTIVAAIAVSQAIEEITGLSASIKWPNDILIDARKVSGILVERLICDGKPAIITGIGVNMRRGSYPPELTGKAVSIQEVLGGADGSVIDDRSVIEGIWSRYEEAYGIFVRTNDLSGLVSYYNSRLINAGRIVRVLDPAVEYEARAMEIDHSGRLMIEKADGIRLAIDSGEVSVRGVDGYI